MLNCVEQNDRHDVVGDTFAENATEEFGLFCIVNNTYCGDDVRTAKKSRIK
jgi:hypothetical protein